MTVATILVVDDDSHIREVLRYALEKEGMTVHEAANGQEGLQTAKAIKPDLIVLDIMMPEMDGLTMCSELRRTSQTPIIFLSSRDEEIDRILGLEMGGDDYVSKPFSPRELVARVKAILKRLSPASDVAPEQSVLSQGHLILDPHSYQVRWQQIPVTLTATEFHLLHSFMRRPEKVFTRDELIEGDIFRDIVTDRTIDSHIRRLRKKLAGAGCNSSIETVHGFGYKLGACQ